VSLQPESHKQIIRQRLNYLYVLIGILFLVLAARLWQLQIIQGSDYAARADRNRIRNIKLVAPRGTIVDRNGSPLVENRPSYNILLYRESISDQKASENFITDTLKINPEDLESRLRRNKNSGLYQPIVLKEDVGISDISIVETHRRDHPEIQLGPEPRRLYRYGRLAAHVLGYMGEVSEEELEKETFPGADIGSMVGKSGVERSYNANLVGTDGARRVLVDSVGREVGILGETESMIGGELHLTLDLKLQTVAEELLQGKVGAIAAMDPRNGEILAMASAPAFNPNNFSARISAEDWNALNTDPDNPMQNRAIQNSYSPGSVFKLIMADAGLEEGVIQDNTRVLCSGATVYYNRVFHCSAKSGHGTMDLESAIAKSCNIFFYALGNRLGISKIAEHARELGIGERTGIDLPGERSGVMPSPEWKEQVRKSKWYAGETISVSIGQGAVSVTPLQVLRAVSAIVTGGKLVTPHVVLHAQSSSSDPGDWPIAQLPIKDDDARKIRQGMWASVNNYGTGHNAQIPGLDICGKTGTVQVLSKETREERSVNTSEFEDHSWFVGFASRDNPEISVVVFIEHGGTGGVAAAPLARDIFKAYYEAHRGGAEIAEEYLKEAKIPAPRR
jgi:penicillin-binding protein 2